MRIHSLAAAVILAAAGPAAPAAAQPTPPNMDEQGLRWERPPSIRRMGRLYPRRALQQGVTRARVDHPPQPVTPQPRPR